MIGSHAFLLISSKINHLVLNNKKARQACSHRFTRLHHGKQQGPERPHPTLHHPNFIGTMATAAPSVGGLPAPVFTQLVD
jgi:hypothetical protein